MNLGEVIRLPLLGVPLDIASNDPRAIALAEESFGCWSALAPDRIEPGPAASFTVRVADRPGPPAPASRLDIEVRDGRYQARAGNVLLTCRLADRQATADVPPALLEQDPAWYRWFVNGTALLPVSQRDRYPLHAAGLVIGDVAMLLIGASGRGKSTLTYAAARAGHRLLDEDTVFVAARGGLRLWAHLERLGLAPDTVRWFPELAALTPRRMPHGKVRLAVPWAAQGIRPALTHAGTVHLIALDRADGSPRIEPIGADRLLRDVQAEAEPGFDLMRDHAGPALAALAACSAYRLTVGDDPRAAVPLLESLAV